MQYRLANKSVVLLFVVFILALSSCTLPTSNGPVNLSVNDLAVFNGSAYDVDCLIDGALVSTPHGKYTTVAGKKSYQSLSVQNSKVGPASDGILPANIIILANRYITDATTDYFWNISGYPLTVKITADSGVNLDFPNEL